MKKKIITMASIVTACAVIGVTAIVLPGKEEKDNSEVTTIEVVKEESSEELKEESADVEEVSSELLMQAERETKKEPEKETEKKYTGPFAGKFMVNINNDYLNVRAKASTSAEVVGKLYVGAGGKVLSKGKKWTKISSGNVVGYVSSDYLLYDEKAEAKANECGTLVVTVNADTLRVREDAGTDSKVIGVVSKGQNFNGYKANKEWIKIEFEGETGYVSADYVTTKLTIGKAVSIEEELEAIRLEQERIAAEKAEQERKEREAAEALARAVAASKIVDTVQDSPYNISEEEAYLLACMVTSEAGYESYEGQLAVANIALNRLKSGRYASMRDVLYAKGQFTVVNTQRFADIVANGPYESTMTAVKDALAGKNNVPGFTSYCANWAAKYDRYTEYTIIGNQVFYR